MLIGRWIGKVKIAAFVLATVALLGHATTGFGHDQPTKVEGKNRVDISWKTHGDPPVWMSSVSAQNQRMTKCRAALAQEMSFEYEAISLASVIGGLQDELDVPFTIVVSELDLLGVDPKTPITLELENHSVGEMLEMTLEPLELTYAIGPKGIEITSKAAAKSNPTIRYFEMTWSIDSPGDVRDLLNLIQITIAQDSHGGVNTAIPIGTVLVVRAPAPTQRKIEKLLANLAELKRRREMSPRVQTGEG